MSGASGISSMSAAGDSGMESNISDPDEQRPKKAKFADGVEEVIDTINSNEEEDKAVKVPKRVSLMANRSMTMTGLMNYMGSHYRSEGSDETGDDDKAHVENAAALLENDVSNMLTHAKTHAGVERSDLERTLARLGFLLTQEEWDEHEYQGNGALPSYKRKSFSSLGSGEFTREKELMLGLFPSKRHLYKVQPQHLGLPAVLQHVFVAQADLLKRSASSMPDLGKVMSFAKNFEAKVKKKLCGPRAGKVTKCLRHITNAHAFVFFFLMLTMYTLVCPDLTRILAGKDVDDAFLIMNSIVFFLFLLELTLIIAAQGSYVVTIPFVLDAVALVSLFLDTWFMAEIATDDDATSLSRLARSSRIARIARIGRVARVTKLVPRAMKLCRKQSNALAEQLLLRRLWRLFQYLDQGRTGLLSQFDLKIFYLALLQECPHVLPAKVDIAKLLEKDTERLLACAPDEFGPHLDVDDFSQVIMGSALGVHLLEFHRRDLEGDGGSVWALTQKLSDSTAMKVCIGVLLLVATMSLLEVEVLDNSQAQGLAQLDGMARIEHAKGAAGDWEHLCVQVDVYRKHNDLMYLTLNSWVHWDDGKCLHPGNGAQTVSSLESSARIDDLLSEANLRDDEYLLLCTEGNSAIHDCRESFTHDSGNRTLSLSLVDLSARTKDAAFYSLMTVLAVLIQIPISVYVLNMKISTFSSTLLQPLRSLVDDMVAMSSLELVGIDDEAAPGMLTSRATKHKIKLAEELENLNSAFRAMRSAIRSWSKFVPPSVVERFYDAGLEATVGVTRLEVTVLFCDIDGFEETCREFRPQVVLAQLTGVLGTIADVIQLQNGTFLEFISDEVMAVFNAPNTLPNHASAALSCAISIHQAVSDAHAVDGNPIRCRIGVHTANILAGNIGSNQRIKYGLLGDGVNLAARMKGLNSRYKTLTLASENALNSQQTQLPIATRPVDLVAVKGKTEPTKVFEVLSFAVDNPLIEQGALRHTEAFALYEARRFEEAVTKFEEANALLEAADLGEDEPSLLMCRRCEEYIKHPPPEDWDGVERLKTKSFAPPKPSDAPAEQASSSQKAGGTDERSSSSSNAAKISEAASRISTDESQAVHPEEYLVEERNIQRLSHNGCDWKSFMSCREREAAEREVKLYPIDFVAQQASSTTGCYQL
eukprot:gb/GFBE01033314.1/.p1 GENE.gb/GFBE01033314.1/~~gb/GFBE01033314.1/.p1  ORF type:complete len:1159 (+),score=267.68 gb/GFBE01033314.1/:1-3477(+)